MEKSPASLPAIELPDGTRLRFVPVPPGNARDTDPASYLEELACLFDSLFTLENRLTSMERIAAAADLTSAIKALANVCRVRFQLQPVRETLDSSSAQWKPIRLCS